MTPKDPRLVDAERNVERLSNDNRALTRSAAAHPASQEILHERDKSARELRTALQAVETVQKAIEQERFDARVGGLQREIDTLERQMSEVALKGAEDPSNADLRSTLVAYRNERDAYRMQIEELHMARTAAANRDVEKEEKARKAHIAELVAQHKAAGAAAVKHAVDLIDYLAAAGPKWAAATRAVQEVVALNFALLRLVGGSKAMNAHSMSAGAMAQPLVLGIVSALAATRIAQDGPSMAPYVAITTPMGPATGATQVEVQMQNQLKRHIDTWAHYEPGFFNEKLTSPDFFDLGTPATANAKG